MTIFFPQVLSVFDDHRSLYMAIIQSSRSCFFSPVGPGRTCILQDDQLRLLRCDHVRIITLAQPAPESCQAPPWVEGAPTVGNSQLAAAARFIFQLTSAHLKDAFHECVHKIWFVLYPMFHSALFPFDVKPQLETPQAMPRHPVKSVGICFTFSFQGLVFVQPRKKGWIT